MSVSKCVNSLERYNSFVSQLEPKIGAAGGRNFKDNASSKTYTLNDVVKYFSTEYLTKNGSVDNENEISERIITRIEELDRQANEQLKTKNVIIRVLTAVRQFFGNLFYNRNAILKGIKKIIKDAKSKATQAPAAPKAKAKAKKAPKAPIVYSGGVYLGPCKSSLTEKYMQKNMDVYLGPCHGSLTRDWIQHNSRKG